MKYTITNANLILDDRGNPRLDEHGNKSFKVWAKDESGQTYNFFKNTKGEVKAGDVLEGVMTQEISKAGNPYTKFTPDKAPFTGGRSFTPRSPEDQAMIVRQRSLKAAVDFFAAKLPTMAKTKQEAVSPEVVIKLAEIFSQYVLKAGELPPTKPHNAPQDEETPDPDNHHITAEEVQRLMDSDQDQDPMYRREKHDGDPEPQDLPF